MESNGKRVDVVDGHPGPRTTGPIVWGTPGTNGQHAYFQLLHQGTTIVPVDLIGFVRPVHDLGEHHDLLIANLIAQAEALAFGPTPTRSPIGPRAVPHRTFPGNRPTTVILADGSRPAPSASWSPCTSTRCSSQGRSGGSTASTNGASSSARPSPRRSSPRCADGRPRDGHDTSTTRPDRPLPAGRGRPLRMALTAQPAGADSGRPSRWAASL